MSDSEASRESVSSRFGMNSIAVLASQLLNNLLAAVVAVVLVRYFGREEYGIFTTVFTYLSFFAVFQSLGVDTIVLRDIARDPRATEHLGGVVYDGIWVGEGSKIPNTGGIRTALVEHLKRINAPVVRWPGGCFADSYDWRDGIGPLSARPKRTNFWVNTKVPPGPQQYDPNSFGTIEFLRFCRLAGAQPYLAANVRSLPPRDFYEIVSVNPELWAAMRAEADARRLANAQILAGHTGVV